MKKLRRAPPYVLSLLFEIAARLLNDRPSSHERANAAPVSLGKPIACPCSQNPRRPPARSFQTTVAPTLCPLTLLSAMRDSVSATPSCPGPRPQSIRSPSLPLRGQIRLPLHARWSTFSQTTASLRLTPTSQATTTGASTSTMSPIASVSS